MAKTDKYNIEESFSEMKITYSWYSHSAISLMLLFIAATLIFLSQFFRSGFDLVVFIFFLVGIYCFYQALCIIFNTTEIRVNKASIKIRSYPLHLVERQ